MELRDYQNDVVQRMRESFARGNRRIVLQAPTGAGKTVIASNMIESAADKGKRVLFLAHRRELVHQCADKLLAFGVEHGVIMAGEFLQYDYEVQVASIDTLRARALDSDRIPLPKADLIFIDEAHRSLAPTYLRIMNEYPNAAIIGMTATPCRTDNRGLGDVYEDIVRCPSVAELTKQGHLVPCKYFAPSVPDLTGIKVTAGDYNAAQLEKAMDQRKLVGDVITHWLELAEGRPTVVFASGVKHSLHLRDEFVRAGVSAVHIDGEMSREDRDKAIKGIREGRYKVVTNCMVLTEGFDEPALSCCVMARPTKSLSLFLQMAGRTLRPASGKEDTLLIDHSGNVYAHGLVKADRDWPLVTSKVLPKDHKHKIEARVARTITCTNCSHVYEGQLVCPHCGHKPEMKGRYVETKHGHLTRLTERKMPVKARQFSDADKHYWYGMFRGYAKERGYADGWAGHSFKKKFGHFPERLHFSEPLKPTPECVAYIRHLAIRYAHGKRKAEERKEARR
jgi:superfamily II DNA or RNA helicase